MRKPRAPTVPREKLLEALNRTEESVAELDRRRQKLLDQVPDKGDFDRVHNARNPVTERQQQIFAINLAKMMIQWSTHEECLARVLTVKLLTVRRWLWLRSHVTTKSLRRINGVLKLADPHELIDRELSFDEIEKAFPGRRDQKRRKGVRRG